MMVSRLPAAHPDITLPSTGRPLALKRARRWLPLIAGLLVIVTLFGSAFAFSERASINDDPGLLFVIPKGASSTVTIPTIDSAIAIPTDIRFGRGETARVTVRNDDDVANRAGPWVVGPGQTYTARFDEPGVYQFDCAVDAAESVTITVTDG